MPSSEFESSLWGFGTERAKTSPRKNIFLPKAELNRGSCRIVCIEHDWRGIHNWQWHAVKALLPRQARPFLKRRRKGGRPRADDRKCFEAILWSARTGISLRRLPERFGKPRTAARRLEQWHRNYRLHSLWARFLQCTGPTERADWRRRLNDACGHAPVLWRLELQAILNIEWPDEKRYT
jgi:transposase